MTLATLKPAEGRFVRDPVTRLPLAEAGEEKVLDTFWRRRLIARDVELIEGGTPSGAATGGAGAEGSTGEKTPARQRRGSQE